MAPQVISRVYDGNVCGRGGHALKCVLRCTTSQAACAIAAATCSAVVSQVPLFPISRQRLVSRRMTVTSAMPIMPVTALGPGTSDGALHFVP